MSAHVCGTVIDDTDVASGFEMFGCWLFGGSSCSGR